jgi:hypothetical protein
MLTARTNAAAILLEDGRVVITGGESSGHIANTLEMYEPAENRFRIARGALSSATRASGVDNVLIFGVHADHPRAAHVRATAGAELFVPALISSFLPASWPRLTQTEKLLRTSKPM